MKTFSIRSLGCTVNHYESQQIRQALEHLRLAPIGVGQDPDLVVVNTCCVTAKASVKSRLSLIASRRVCPTGDDDTPSSPDSLIRPNTGLQIKSKDGNSPQTLPTLSRFEGQTRALLKVQEGCDGHCAYWIVPQTRPMLSSKPLQEVVAEAQTLVRSGHQEIVITGVYLGDYGQQTVLQKEWPRHIQPGSPSPHNRYPRRFPRRDGGQMAFTPQRRTQGREARSKK
jgi:threonylcarbamoyladenosine tRNA methylthiotransferase MtaB